MPYSPPRYAPRADWKEKLPTMGPPVNSWQLDILKYWEWRTTGDLSTNFRKLSLNDAWIKLGMDQENARKALATQAPRPTNDAGLVPPEIASRVFARSLAKSAAPDADTVLTEEPAIAVSAAAVEPSFKPPRYRPRSDWQAKLESMDPEVGSWQADLVRYWLLRTSGKTEDTAWDEVRMSPRNASMALMTEPETPDNESGLIPCVPGRETVARRVLARSVAKAIDAHDIYDGLILEP